MVDTLIGFKDECVQPGAKVRAHHAFSGICSQNDPDSLIDVFFKCHGGDLAIRFQAGRKRSPTPKNAFFSSAAFIVS